MSPSHETDLSRMLSRARRKRLFESLTEIYGTFPETQCDNCARCCFESPGVFFVEFLHILDHLSHLPRRRRRSLLRQALAELFFSWIDPGRQCAFLESSRCLLYDRRPLACRLFGLVSPGDRDRAEAEARLAARQEARRLRLFGIEVPEAVVQRSLVSCDRVRDADGLPVRVDADPLAARVARLDEALLPREVVVREFCFRSLPERLGCALLGADAVEPMRVQVMRRAQRGEATEDLLEALWRQAQWPRFL